MNATTESLFLSFSLFYPPSPFSLSRLGSRVISPSLSLFTALPLSLFLSLFDSFL